MRKVPDLFVTFHSPLKDKDVKLVVSTVTFWPCMLRKKLAVIKKVRTIREMVNICSFITCLLCLVESMVYLLENLIEFIKSKLDFNIKESLF